MHETFQASVRAYRSKTPCMSSSAPPIANALAQEVRCSVTLMAGGCKRAMLYANVARWKTLKFGWNHNNKSTL